MRTISKIALTSVATVGSLAIGASTPAFADHDVNPSPKIESYVYKLNSVQSSDVPGTSATGITRLTALPDGKVLAVVIAKGLAPNQPHAMHLHGVTEGADKGCPGPAADTNGDGVVTVVEGAPFYGGIQSSLTTSGDTSPSSGLDLGRMQNADKNGKFFYVRLFDAPDVAKNLGSMQLVIHGADFDGNGEYAINPDDEFASKESSLKPGVPLEATVPVLCGGIAN